MKFTSFETPVVELADVAHLLAESYGLALQASPLPGEWDLNLLLSGADGPVAVLKVSHAEQDRGWLELETAALDWLAQRAPDVAFPRTLRTRRGEALASLPGQAGRSHAARLLSFVPGRRYAEARPHDRKLLRSLGRALAKVGKALQGFSSPLLRRPLKWDLDQALWIEGHLDAVSETPARARVRDVVDTFKREVVPRLGHLRRQALYNDANDHNILVVGGEVAGFVDLGDMVESALVHDLAIAAAYALMGQAAPLEALGELVAAYHQELPLTEEELGLLWTLIQVRLSITVVNSAVQLAERPANRYLEVSQGPAQSLLAQMAGEHPRKATYALRAACGLPAHPDSRVVADWLKSNTSSFASLVTVDPRTTPCFTLDWSFGSLDLGGGEAWSRLELEAHVARARAASGLELGIGRYLEPRVIYAAPAFEGTGLERDEPRTIHLGADLFLGEGSPVHAPLAGRVHSVQDNAGDGNYGPTVILVHQAGPDGPCFWTLYGHLDPGCLEALRPGTEVAAGAVVGHIGGPERNGGWPPHLHFQVLLDLLDGAGDFPGVARPGEARLFEDLCPDPNFVLGVPGGISGWPESEASLLSRRGGHVGPSLSISYDQPIHVVRGYMQHLWDAHGRRYLDMVNNVPHVGHANPRVVRAAARQLAVLNTNTRYLHPLMEEYAERLTATLPPALSVCYFVNSGSEANELALRLARTATGRTGAVVVDVAYHGNTTTLIDISPYKHESRGGRGAPPWVRKVALPDAYRGRFRGPGTGPAYAALVDEAIDALESAGHPAGVFIAESLLGCGGQIVLPDGYLAEAFRRVRRRGGLCIADEVQVGFGRAGSHFWAFEQQGVVPDVVTLGKPIGNGWPLGAVVTTPAIARAFDNGMEYFSTFGGNQASLAVGLAVLDEIRDRGLQANAQRVGGVILDGLRELQRTHEALGDVRGLGLYIGAELVRTRDRREPFAEAAAHVANRLRAFGVLVSTDGPDHNVLKIKPPMVVTEEDAARLLVALGRALAEDAAQP